MILKLWCKGTNKWEDYNGINAEPLTNGYAEKIIGTTGTGTLPLFLEGLLSDS